ncbi:BZIP family transcription factor [Colletotrichum sojae]|uniref:BZIP family transcription factor n=1 Tax=Colletotrichum sojae TaxID=2175907 RepID=A0A8H6JPK5_9PEZI|nr:BZIP family transcription factor [Colletotrichum sojae]
MSNHHRPSPLDAQPEPNDDVDEPPPPLLSSSRETTQLVYGSLVRGGNRGASTSRPRTVIQLEQGQQPVDFSVYDFPILATPTDNTIRGEGDPLVNSHSHSHSHPHPSADTPTNAQPHQRHRHQDRVQDQGHHQENHPRHHHQRLAQQTIVLYDPQQHSHPHPHQSQHNAVNPPQQHQQQISFSYTSPPDCSKPASLASSPPDSSSFLRHPHDPRLLQAQFQPGSSYELAPDPGLPPNTGDLVPIQFQGLQQQHIIQQPFVVFSPPDPAGPALPFIPTADDPDFTHHHRLGGVLQFPSGYPMTLMQNPELSILNAESYDDGVSGFRAPRSLPAGRSRAATGSEPTRSRKRTKAQSADDGEPEEEEKKRSRGRPRLDTNDQTAKERRRTQIRLAQRAYRNRKETAIQTLEKKVDQLKTNNEEMSKAFMKLYDFAVSKGMLESAPEFGRQLQATTEKFVSLARRTSEDAGNEAEARASQEQEESEGHDESPPSGPEKPGDKSGSSPDAPKTGHALYGGYMVENDAVAFATPRSHAMAAVHTDSWAQDSQILEARAVSSQAPLGYEIVTEPTLDNASFPFGMSLEGGLDIAPGQLGPSAQPFSDSPYSLIPAPSSYAYQERTFGRRLQRSTLERAYTLMRMPNPPPDHVAAVFGFCLLFESREQILERLTNRLSVNQRETLYNWRFPFLHLGGGGTFFDTTNNEMNSMELPRAGKPQCLLGNQGSLEPDRAKVDSPYGMGPWDAATESVRDVRIDRRLRMDVPGFDGDFFDADEVEWVMRQRGVVIPPAADFVTAEIDPSDFSDGADIEGRTFDSAMGNYGMTNLSEPGGPQTGAPSGQGHGPARGTEMAMDLTDTQSASLSSRGEPSPPMNLDPSLGGDVFGMAPSSATHTPSSPSAKRLVTLNVGMFVWGKKSLPAVKKRRS